MSFPNCVSTSLVIRGLHVSSLMTFSVFLEISPPRGDGGQQAAAAHVGEAEMSADEFKRANQFLNNVSRTMSVQKDNCQ